MPEGKKSSVVPPSEPRVFARNPAEIIAQAQAYAEESLADLCADFLAWKDDEGGNLSDGPLRRLAQILRPVAKEGAMSLALSMVHAGAARLVVAQRDADREENADHQAQRPGQ